MDQEETVFIDANIFLEYLLEDKKAEDCEKLFYKIKSQEINAKTSDFIIYTCLLQIQNKLKSLEIMKKFILFINQLNLKEIIRPSLRELYNAVKLAEKYEIDFDDGLVVSCMINNDVKRLISFDKHFNKIGIINREEP